MNKKDKKELDEEMRQVNETFLHNYEGILANNKKWKSGPVEEIQYIFDCPEYLILEEKYHIKQIAGNGKTFGKVQNLLAHFGPKLTHASNYDNHVECNALSLLEYSYDNPKQGINCLNKSKIFEEILLALGIKARRVAMMPYSPYDFDNHVVNEYYDDDYQKWIMVDLTTSSYLVNHSDVPLSLLEIRHLLAGDHFIAVKEALSKENDMLELRNKSLGLLQYYAKNCFYFAVDKISTFGEKDKNKIYILPSGFNLKEQALVSIEYRLKYFVEHKMKKEIDYFTKKISDIKRASNICLASYKSLQ